MGQLLVLPGGFAKDLLARLKALNSSHLDIKLQDLAEYREEDLEKEDIVFLITSTWTDGTSPEKCAMFFEHIKDFAYDFRVSKDYLSKAASAASDSEVHTMGTTMQKRREMHMNT